MAEAVHAVGFKELRSALTDVDRSWGPELAKGHRELARWLAPLAQVAASASGGETGHFAGKIKGQGTQAGARLEVAQEANAAFWGAERRTGWNEGHGGAPQHRKWVGVGWEPGGPGGPYAINPTIAANVEQIVDRFGDMVDELTHRAFPGGT